MSKQIEEYIEEKEKQVSELQREISKARKLSEKYENLTVDIDRWNTVRYSSSSVNGIATDCSFRHSCGCCEDAVLLASPHIVDEETQTLIYSNPATFQIGEKEPYFPSEHDEDDETSWFPERYYSNWREKLEGRGISQKVIEYIESYLKKYAGWEDNDG